MNTPLGDRPARIRYVSFDRVPAPKGAAVHIAAFVRALGRAYAPVQLVTLAPSPEPGIERPVIDWRASPRANPLYPGVTHVGLEVRGRNLIERALAFRGQLASLWGGRRIPAVHVRSIYEGYPIARRKPALCDKLLYEVNGLPSIELKYHYPAVVEDRELMAKLAAQEQALLRAADLIVTPSRVTAELLHARGARPERVRVIENGVDVNLFHYREPRPWQRPDGSDRPVRLLYCGTLTPWQGIGYALEALRLYRRDFPAALTIVGPGRRKHRQRLADLCHTLDLGPLYEPDADADSPPSDRPDAPVTLLRPMSQAQLAALHHEHDAVLAPLPANDRNLVQGCCPLKVIEAMASGTPLVASDIPVVRDLVRADTEALLVKPGSGKAIKDALLRLRVESGLGRALSRAARDRAERQWTWERSCARLIATYEELLGPAQGLD